MAQNDDQEDPKLSDKVADQAVKNNRKKLSLNLSRNNSLQQDELESPNPVNTPTSPDPVASPSTPNRFSFSDEGFLRTQDGVIMKAGAKSAMEWVFLKV
ncbi:hypothetical protein phytr_10570 [Candidatus Phycorickettsia trachydisci]|uniref:Uncharacterized protein n=1 Tax=Candidatus Phycorickettsia trachydisci TaxID=2115978 RepID=A0A2P1P9R4_9RICK|nr:hypothetical protein [Candidatus Phycorickettsia trachydisci]AVP87985.1 hypothetical protein phytr_10570 [Candidatus Phycorickettsia trachydisci]